MDCATGGPDKFKNKKGSKNKIKAGVAQKSWTTATGTDKFDGSKVALLSGHMNRSVNTGDGVNYHNNNMLTIYDYEMKKVIQAVKKLQDDGFKVIIGGDYNWVAGSDHPLSLENVFKKTGILSAYDYNLQNPDIKTHKPTARNIDYLQASGYDILSMTIIEYSLADHLPAKAQIKNR